MKLSDIIYLERRCDACREQIESFFDENETEKDATGILAEAEEIMLRYQTLTSTILSSLSIDDFLKRK